MCIFFILYTNNYVGPLNTSNKPEGDYDTVRYYPYLILANKNLMSVFI